MPILFTSKGLIHLQRKLEGLSEKEREEKERKERKGKHAKEELEEQKAIDKVITMEWLNANPDVEIIAEDQSTAYHTYASVKNKAFTYKKIIYKELYAGIDVVYSFTQNNKAGFEYSLIVKPGADLSKVKMKFGGDVKKIKTDANGNLVIQSAIGGITETIPLSYYNEQKLNIHIADVKSIYKIEKNVIGFYFPNDYDHTKTIVIDPFITGTGNLTGLNAGKAKDVDFDYAGNIYVTGGGNSTVHELAKFNAAGVLQWTFSGALTIPSWTFGSYWGGWMVEKPTGNVYLGQGFNPVTGFQVIRVSTTGLYDNYITDANPNFREAWKMYWSCNNGSPQILVAGGGTNSDINFGIFTPPSTTIGSLNVTGIPYTGTAGWAQDIVDFIIDPANNDMYTIYGSLFGNPSLTNKIYKNTAPYSGTSVAWNVPSGFTSVEEIANRPYLLGGQIDNSANIFAINGSYLYYWDGKNLKAFDKATGNGVGTPLVTANTTLMQGGIIADACNNIFAGDGNGMIKVYKFNGSIFDDAAAPDIPIPGFSGKAVYDLAYDESKKLLYASGDGFAASFDVSSYCPTTQYTLNVAPDCLTSSATVTVSPAPPFGSTVTYVLSIGAIQIATNTTGVFTGLNPNVTYAVVATINLACSGTQATTTFVLPGPTISITQTNTTCGNNTGVITAIGSGTTAPYTYSIDGITFKATGTFTGLPAGVYTVTVKDANGCRNTNVVTILNTNGPTLAFTSTNADCGNNNGTITANITGGTAPYQYSIDGIIFQNNNFFTGLIGGTYTLTVKDATGCTNAVVINITSSPSPLITAIPASATCGSSNGTITAFGSGGTGALQYSINGNSFQVSNVFTNLTPGSYTVYVKDANGCSKTTTVTIADSPAPTVTAVSTPAACNNINGTITATGIGGIAPLQYSIDGVFFQTSNIFTGLAPGSYTITVKDNTGCTNITAITVSSTGGPLVTAASTVSICSTNTGTITATASGGLPGYQYSINGITFQASNIFNTVGAGNYVVYVKDAAGCIGTVTVVVGNTAGPSLKVVSTPTACNTNTGSITATGTGGTAPLQYSIDGTTYQVSNIFTGLATGTYTLYVKDANGCIKTINVNVVNVSGLSIEVSSISSSCSTNNGIITATATGGVAPLQYSINGVTYQASNIFSGLSTGTFTVYVKDANGCIVTKQVTVASASGLSLAVLVQQNATCGSASGVIIATGTGGVAPLTYNIDGGAFQPTGTFINVTAATHTITVKDATGCTAPSQTVTITNSGAGTAPTDVTFTTVGFLTCTGEGRIKNLKGLPNGGGNKYTFSLDGGAFTNANQFRPVNPGVHTITAMNQNGCTVSKLATIGIDVPATATATATGTSCNTTNGTITITGVGVNTPYHASINGIGGPWNTFATTFTFTGLAPGTYSIIIADDADFTTGPPDIPGACLTTINVVVPALGGPTITTTQINGTCASNNGSITASGSGGTAPYAYNINGGTYFASGVFNNLTPGTYAVGIKDATGCSGGVNVTLPSSSSPQVSAVMQSTSCNLNNGSITATVTGGIAPLEYSINGTTFQSSNIFTNLAPGNYTLYAADANKCYGTLPVTIINTLLPKVTAFTIAATCNNNDGSIVAEGSQGTAPYTYSINGTVYQSSNTFNGLAAGFYAVYIQDARGCITTTGVSVANSIGPLITNAVTTSANCGNATGSITVTASGGVAPLQYSINGINFQTSNIFPALLPGDYTVIVRDVNGCLTTKTISIDDNKGPQILTAITINSACGLNNGTITAAASGGVAPLQYSINGTTYQAGTTFNNVASGSYTLYVKDVNGCIKTLPVTILNLPPPALTATSSSSSCGANDGTITAIAIGGTLPLTYSKDGITFQASNIFLNLAFGPYTITVKDARGCTATSNITVSILGTGITPTFNAVPAICSGGILSALPTTSLNGIIGTWSPVLNNTSTTTYTFTPTVGQCATTTTLTITVNSNVTPNFNPVAPICSGGTLSALPTTSLNGITGTWSPALNNTATTTYTFTPTAGQCATTVTLTITVNPNIIPTFNSVAPICSGGTLTPLPIISLNNITGTWSPALNNTASTTYTFTPAAGQCATTVTLTIAINPTTTPTFNPVAAICSGATLTPLPTTSLNGIAGTWSPALNNITTTTYTFTPTAGQCATITTLTITVNPNVIPTFNAAPPICSGGTLAPLPTTSLNGITGTWSPALNNTATTTYTFTPTAGQCATTITLTITINPNITPTFNPIGALCQNSTAPLLPLISNNGISGTWNPSLINTATIGTTTYTFIPSAGQCAITASLDVTIATQIIPVFTAIDPLCVNSIAPLLPASSNNGINGTWNPATINTTTAGTTTYTFTPAAGQCATAKATLDVIIITPVVPGFNSVASICSGDVLLPLPTTSVNSISGTWLPALNNSTTTTYTFTPITGQCATTTTLTITVNTVPVAPAVNVTQPTCTVPNGTIFITSGTTGFTFSFDGGAYITYPAGGYLTTSGTHTLIAQNTSGCISVITTVIVNVAPAAPTSIITTVTDASCGSNNGTLTLGSVTGGTLPYNYSVDGSAFTTTLVYTNLASGLHSITVKDVNGCSFSTSITINNSNGAIVTALSTNSSCGASNGMITATGSGGTTPYLYSIDGINFQASNIFTRLAANVYTISIKDANNCINTTSATIATTNGAAVTATSTDASCGASNGSITATGSGGLKPYQFSINGTTFQASNIFTNLAANNYTVTIKDANNCTNTTSVVLGVSNVLTLNAGPDINICEGTSKQLSASSNGTIFSWSPQAGLNNPSILNPVASPATTTKYILTAILGQCSKSDTIIVFVNPAPVANSGKDTNVCFGKNYQLNGSGALLYQWSPPTYLSNTGISNPVLISPPPGILHYILSVTDINGCTSLKGDTVAITILPEAKVFAGPDTSILVNQPLQLNGVDINNSGFTSYIWSPSSGLNNPFIKDPIAIVSRDTRYILTARTPEGCETSDDINIKVFVKTEVYVPSAFTPNDDGLNDIFKPICFGIKELKYFTVLNRFGQIVYTTTKLTEGWDGTYKGKTQDGDVFVWILEAMDFNGNLINKKGIVVLIR